MKPPILPLSALAAAAFLAPLAHSQDMVAVAWGGATYLVDSYTAALTPLGTGLAGQNALARDAAGTFWSTQRVGSSTYFLTIVDPGTGSATQVHASIDLRGLATGPGATLWGISQPPAFSSPDSLVQIDTATGAVTTIGTDTGLSSLQGCAMHQGTLYGWDLAAGLVILDTSTGLAIDPFPGVGGPSGLQTLCSHPDGRLLVARNDLHVVDTTTGMTTLIGSFGSPDIRGIEPLSGGAIIPFGLGCNGVGGQVSLTVTGTPQVGGTLQSVSDHHDLGGFGVVCLGIDTGVYLGLTLPLLLDPLFGTSNCTLYTSIDAAIIVLPTTPDQMVWNMSLGAGAAGAEFHMQHAFFEPVPGGMSWSNAVTIRVQ